MKESKGICFNFNGTLFLICKVLFILAICKWILCKLCRIWFDSFLWFNDLFFWFQLFVPWVWHQLWRLWKRWCLPPVCLWGVLTSHLWYVRLLDPRGGNWSVQTLVWKFVSERGIHTISFLVFESVFFSNKTILN